MHDQVLLLPDGGFDFMRTVRLAALYADKVHVYSPAKQSTIDGIANTIRMTLLKPEDVDTKLDEIIARHPDYAELVKEDPASKPILAEHFKRVMCDHPAFGYLRLSVANRSDLELLAREKVLKSIIDDILPNLPHPVDAFPAFLGGLQGALLAGNMGKFPQIPIPEVYRSSNAPPTVCLLFEFLLEYVFDASAANGGLPEELATILESNDEMVTTIAAGTYFIMSSYYALLNGCVGITSDDGTQQLFDRCSEALTAGVAANNPLLAKRERIKNRLGEVILRDQVPDVSELPLPEILEIRRKREPELKAFRDGLRQLAADIDPNTGESELALALDTKLQSVVRPALNDLQAAVRELQIEAYRQLFSPADSLVAGGVTFAISSLAGMPAGLNLNLGALGVLVAKLYDFTIGKHLEEQKLLTKSPWSVLFHLNKRGPA